MLNNWNILSRIGTRNELLINLKKISGSACHVHENRIMTHGMLLYDSNLDTLNKSLSSNSILFNDKAVKSVKSDVTNIKNVLYKSWDTKEFMTQLEAKIRINADAEFYELKKEGFDAIEDIRKIKYETWEWYHGNSPSYSFSKQLIINNLDFIVDMVVKKGRIESLNMITSHPNNNLPKILSDNIIGCFHENNVILSKLKNIASDGLFPVSDISLLELFFKIIANIIRLYVHYLLRLYVINIKI